MEEIRASAAPPSAGPVPTRRQSAGYEQHQRLWYLVLSLVLVLMLVEAFSANWIVGKRSIGI